MTPFLWMNGKGYTLQSLLHPRSGWVLQTARGINNRGCIVGTGIHNGRTRGFLLTPVKQ